MNDEAPPGGFPLRWAITALAIGEGGLAWVELYELGWKTQNHADMAEAQRHLWVRLMDRAHRGEVIIRGVRDGTTESVVIGSELLSGGTPDYATDTLLAVGIVWHAVTVVRTSGSQNASTASTTAPIAGNRPSTLDGSPPMPTRPPRGFAKADMKLFPEWERLVADGSSWWAAAALLAPRATGNGVEESKTKRLYDRFTQLLSSTQSRSSTQN